jgi:hypothetical protein
LGERARKRKQKRGDGEMEGHAAFYQGSGSPEIR